MQKAICVSPIPNKDTFLDLTELQAALEDGWIVDQTQASSTGSILVILKKEPS